MYLVFNDFTKVAMEAGNFTQALAEFSSCLDARTSVLPKDSRYLSLTYLKFVLGSNESYSGRSPRPISRSRVLKQLLVK